METTNAQVRFFQHLKALLPAHLAMVDEVAQLLGISNDSAYRRIRGEKPIDLEETYKLCSHFKVSMDQLLHLQSDAFIFTGALKNNTPADFEKWLGDLYRQFTYVNTFERKQFYYLLKDIPPFMYFQVPELATFKYFFWMKSILGFEDFKGVKFSFDDPRYDIYREISQKIIRLYNNVPTTEIWNIENINNTLRQAGFYLEAGLLTRHVARIIYDKTEELINHIEQQAELGVKFMIGEKPGPVKVEYRLFVNELILGDNTIVAELGDRRITFLNHSVIYFAATGNEQFNAVMHETIMSLIKKSTLISTVGEKERVSFFNRLRHKIDQRRLALK